MHPSVHFLPGLILESERSKRPTIAFVLEVKDSRPGSFFDYLLTYGNLCKDTKCASHCGS